MKGINQKDRGIRVAAAPINRGVTGLDPANLDPDDVLDTVVSTGYDGSELGPLGYLATTEEDLQHRFAPRQLDLASAFVAVSLAVPIGRSAAEDFRAVLRLLAAGGSARVLVSDAASDDRLAVAGRVSAHPETSWSDTDWIQAVQTLAELAAIAAEHGLGLACHPHAGSHLESAGEIARLLESTDPQTVALCLDTGHAIIGGADPVELLHAVGTRTVHVHAKDVDPALLEQLRNGAMTYTEAVGAGM